MCSTPTIHSTTYGAYILSQRRIASFASAFEEPGARSVISLQQPFVHCQYAILLRLSMIAVTAEFLGRYFIKGKLVTLER